MSDHDDLCPLRFQRTDAGCIECAHIRRVRADEREAEQAQREALARLLLDSGDITPAGARLLTQPSSPPFRDHDPLCPMVIAGAYPICVCGVIGKVRAEERERIARAIEAHGAHLRISDEPVILRSVAAQIARNGGRDE